jgi:uncharacterized protein YjbI with pentapeptide repeats
MKKYLWSILSILKKHWRKILIVLVALILAGLFVLAIYHWVTGVPWPSWTGFSDYTGPLSKDDRGKTLWDWMGLLIIPLVLAVGAYLFNRAEKENELKIAKQRYKNDQEISMDRQREQTLQNYIDKMNELLLEKKLRTSQTEDEVRAMARTRTLTTLRLLDSKRKGILLRFLFEAELISTNESIVNLKDADLEGADLNHAFLKGVNLALAHLEGAILEGTFLIEANLSDAYLKAAKMKGAYLKDANLTDANLECTDLRNVDLMGADLTVAKLDHADLRGADLKIARLTGASLMGTNLVGADLTGADFERASLANADLTGVTMPDGTKYDPVIHTSEMFTGRKDG